MGFLNHILSTFMHLGLWGYWLVLLVSFLESLVLAGEIVPGAVLVVFAGFLSAQGFLDIGNLILFAAIGAILGDGLSFYLGAKGTHFFRGENKFLKSAHLERGGSFFYKHGSKSIFLGRFIGPLRPIIPFVAGLSKMDKKKFMFWNIVSAFLWSAFHLLLGFFFGSALAVIETWTTRVGYIIGIFFLFFLLLYAIKALVGKHGKRIAEFICSIFSSIREAIISNPDIQKLYKRHPRFFTFLIRRLNRASFSGLPMTLILIGFVYVSFLFFSTVQDILASDQIVATDFRIAHLLAYFRSPEFTKIFLWITLLGKWQIVVGTAIAVSVILWLWKKKEFICYLWLALGADELFNYLGKLAVHRVRPDNPVYLENSFSFPSGHAMVSVIFYGFLGYLLIRHLKNWKQKVNVFFVCFIIAIAIGFSRLYLGVHYFSDVWGGYLLGLLILATIITLYEWRRFKRGKVISDAITATPSKKIATAIIIVLNAVWYISFASYYQPRFVVPVASSVQYVSGDIVAYFSDHNISKYSETLIGDPQEPLAFIFLAKNDNVLIQSFEKSSWFLADQVDVSSMIKIVKTAVINSQYRRAPMTPSFWNAAVNDFGFEKPTNINTVRERHHIRIWKTNLKQGDYSIYVGTASLDEGIKWFITHKINPDIDTERNFVKESLQSAGVIADAQEVQFVSPMLGENFGGDQFFTNGKLYIIWLK